jgi:integrase
VLSQAGRGQKLPADPRFGWVDTCGRGDEPKQQIQPLACAEAAHPVAVAREHFPQWHLWVLLTLPTGLGLGEQLALQWGDIDWAGRFLFPPESRARGPDLSEVPPPAPRRYLRAAALSLDRVAPTSAYALAKEGEGGSVPSREGTAHEDGNVRHVFTRMLEKAQLRLVRIHDLRHTFASLLLQQGASPWST